MRFGEYVVYTSQVLWDQRQKPRCNRKWPRMESDLET